MKTQTESIFEDLITPVANVRDFKDFLHHGFIVVWMHILYVCVTTGFRCLTVTTNRTTDIQSFTLNLLRVSYIFSEFVVSLQVIYVIPSFEGSTQTAGAIT